MHHRTLALAWVVLSIALLPLSIRGQDGSAEATISALRTQVADLEGEAVTPTTLTRDEAAANEALSEVNVEIIFDVSGSMAQTLGTGESRMEAAKGVMQDVIAAFPEREGLNLGLRIYGHEGDNTEAGAAVSCESSELVVELSGLNARALRREIDQLQPTGWTPIGLSLERAGDDLSEADEASNFIILVTDGAETCGGDPCEVAGELNAGELAVTTSVVGFALTPDEQAAIACIAEEGGGDVLGANDAEGLSEALFTVLSTPVPDIETPTPAPRSADPGTREYPLPIGTAANVGGDWFTSVFEVVPDATDAVLTENQFNDPPEDGYQFFVVRISATYEGMGSSRLPTGNTFSTVGESAVAYKTFDPGCGVIPDPVPSTEVFTGGRIEGNVCWSVRSSDVDSLVMFAEDYVTFDQEIQVWFALR